MKTATLLIALLLTSAASMAQDKQCAATKKNGQQCGSRVAEKETYCRWHDPNTLKCGVKTSKGAPCKMQVANKDETCKYHKGKKKM